MDFSKVVGTNNHFQVCGNKSVVAYGSHVANLHISFIKKLQKLWWEDRGDFRSHVRGKIVHSTGREFVPKALLLLD